MNKIIRYAFVLFLLLVFQFAVFNHIVIGQGVTIFIYLFFFLILPLRTPGWALLMTAFLTGLAVDSVFNTGGIHAFATVFIAFMRPIILNRIEFVMDRDLVYRPGIRSMGWLNFLKYTFIISFIHQFTLFYLEVFHFRYFFYHLLIVLLNTLLTTVICLLIEVLFKAERSRA
jgi:hypothetical protein